MFKRIKNLLDISRYTVEELKQPKGFTWTGVAKEFNTPASEEKLLSSTPDIKYKMATIVDVNPPDPFKDFNNETPQQSLDDTAPRN